MSLPINLLWRIAFVALVYALTLAFLISVLGVVGSALPVAAVLAIPASLVAWIGVRRHPTGRWWLAATVALIATAALLLFAFVLIATSGNL